MPDEQPRDPAALVIAVAAGLTLAGIVMWTLYLAVHAVVLIYISALVAAGITPIVSWIESHRLPFGERNAIPRWAACIAVYLVIAAVIGVIIAVLLPVIITQAQGLAQQLPEDLRRLEHDLIHRRVVSSETMAQIAEQTPSGSDLMPTIVSTAINILGGAIGLVTMFILSFYFLLEAPALLYTFVRLFPTPNQAAARAASMEIGTKVSAWLAAQFLIATTVGICTMIGLGLIGVQYFYVLAIIAALGELVPFAGPIAAATPGILIASMSSWHLGLITGAYYLIQQQLVSNLLSPMLMADRVGLSAAGVLVAVVIGHTLLGVLGAILAVPTAAIAQVVVQRFAERPV